MAIIQPSAQWDRRANNCLFTPPSYTFHYLHNRDVHTYTLSISGPQMNKGNTSVGFRFLLSILGPLVFIKTLNCDVNIGLITHSWIIS